MKFYIIMTIKIITLILFGYIIYTEFKDDDINDCVPATLQRIFPTYSLNQLEAICKTDENGTSMDNMVSAWKLLTTNKLTVIYSHSAGDETNEIQFNVPYLWLGNFQDSDHCALIEFTSTNVLISNSQYYNNTTNYYIVSMDYNTFISNTFKVYFSSELNSNIRFY